MSVDRHADDAALLRKILAPVAPPPQEPLGARAPRCRMVLARTYDLNSSASKILTIGLDATRYFEGYVMIESPTRCGMQLPMSTFLHLTYDHELVAQVNDFIGTRTRSGGDPPKYAVDGVELSCFQLNDGSPAVKYKNSEKAYVIIGAVTWHQIQRMCNILKFVCSENENRAGSVQLRECVLQIVKRLCVAAKERGVTEFDVDIHQGAYRFVLDHANAVWSHMREEQAPWDELCCEVLYKRADVLANIVSAAHKERAMDKWNA